MKKIFLLLLIPLFMATTCDDDDGLINYRTDYSIQNDSTVAIILLDENDNQIVIESATNYSINNDINTIDVAVKPSENNAFNSITLYTLDTDASLILAYEQEPILDDLWTITEPENYSYAYTLVITDDLLN